MMSKKNRMSIETIERWLKDEDWRVQHAAMNACKTNGIPLPVIRTIEPPALVYKKCACGVIVVAEIPADAQVRGMIGGKCRADKAIIKDVIGDIGGEPVGIAKYDLKTLYYAGDEVVIKDFDYSNARCAPGFHFFCTREQAEHYDWS